MTQNFQFANIIIKTPLWRDFDYIVPDALSDLAVGERVVVPFGKRQVAGVVSHFLTETSIDVDKLKPITDRLDDQSFLTPEILKLCRWASDYYHYPLGEVVFGILPKKARVCRSLQLGGIVSSSMQLVESNAYELTPAQQAAFDAVDISKAGVHLLHGVTGSGKTEVYLQWIASVLTVGKQALVLVPEISLTPQTLKRFEARFNVPIVMLHSGLTEKQRYEAWLSARTGQASILIGTRSAVFVPMPALGMIIIDESHDMSFKQQSGFRYSARDVAVVRGHQCGVPVILGSATPSLETLHNAWIGQRYRHLELPERVGNAVSPEVSIVDIRQDHLKAGIGTYLLAHMKTHLAAGHQVMLFLNRRGYAPVLLCHHCGHTMKCPHCDVYLTYHQQRHACCCHHCDYTRAAPRICPECHQAEMMSVGLGTEQLEAVLSDLFPNNRVLRIDRDTTRKKGALEDLLSEAHENSADILVGTQMLAKGHHFRNLTMVAVVDADSGLLSTDFRALERLAQLLVQVAGRAGRESERGEVIIQTHQPDHPLLQTLLTGGFNTFARQLLERRKVASLPPFSHMALFRADAKEEKQARDFLLQMREQIQQSKLPVQVLGPIEAPMAKRAGRHRYQLLLQSSSRPALQQLLAHLNSLELCRRRRRQVTWSLDVDPVELM